MSPPSLILQTTYAELLDRAETAAFADAFPEDGAFISKTIKDKRYWYFQTGKGDARIQRYAGRETPELLAQIAQHKEARHDERERRALVSTLVRSFGLLRPLPEVGDLLAALATAGVFRLRGVLVGTVAYQTYPAMLGVKLASSTLQTGDIDIAQYKTVSLAVADKIPPILEVLREVDTSFRAVPHISENNKSVSYRAKNGIRVDFLTPNEGPDTDAPQSLPSLGTDAQPLRFLDFLIHDPVPAVLLHGSGVLVRVPSPERYAVHKLIVSSRRHAGSAKSDKDLMQAEALLETLWRKRPHDLSDAWGDAYRRGETWRRLLMEGLSRIAPTARDGLLKVLNWPRGNIPNLALAFPDPRPRYDFDRKNVVFTGEDSSGEVRCEISGEAMRDHFGVEGSDPHDYIAKFNEHPSRYEDMAREKYRSWPVEEPGVVVLRTGDIDNLLHKTDSSLTQP
jgi:hypothetical protein